MVSPTLRQIAAKAKVGLATVSLALRDSPLISAKTRGRVKRLAKRMGWRPDPLVSAFQARLRTLRHANYQATLGWIEDHPDLSTWKIQHEVDAARARAEELGYRLDLVRLEEIKRDEPAATAARFQRILRARGIYGIILPRLDRTQLAAEEWPGFSVVLIGSVASSLRLSKVKRRETTPFHEVSDDIANNMETALIELRRRGYQRIGLTISTWHNQINDNLPLAVMLAENTRVPTSMRVPPLMLNSMAYTTEPDHRFIKWIQRHSPDALLISNLEIPQWCQQLGMRIPQDIAIAHIHRHVMDQKLSGIDPRRDLQSIVAIDLLTAHLQRNERDTPLFRKRLLIQGVWRDAGTA